MKKLRVFAAMTIAAILLIAATVSAYAYIPVSHDLSVELVDDAEVTPLLSTPPFYGRPYTLYLKLSDFEAAFIDIADEAPAGDHYTIPEAIQDTNSCSWFDVISVKTVDEPGHQHLAFAGNQFIKTVDFEATSKVESIGAGAFRGSGVSSLTLPKSLKSIGDEALSGSAITEITIPAGVLSIGYGVFAAPKLKKIVFKGTTEPTYTGSAEGAFAGIPQGVTVSYPEGANYANTVAALKKLTAQTGEDVKVEITPDPQQKDPTPTQDVIKTDQKVTVTVAGVVVKSLKAGKKSFTLKWKKLSGIAKYQIRYKLSSAKKWKTTAVAAKATSKVVKKLKSKKYQVQIRAYKTVAKVNYYGEWSAVKTVTVK